MKHKFIRSAAYLVAILGIILHLYLTSIQQTTGITYVLIATVMNIIPYVICILLTKGTAKPVMPLCAGFMILIMDFYMFNGYLTGNRTHRFVLIEIYKDIF